MTSTTAANNNLNRDRGRRVSKGVSEGKFLISFILYDNRRTVEVQMVLDPAVQTVLDAYEKRSIDEHRQWSAAGWEQFVKDRDQYLLAVGPATGLFMNLLIKEAKSRTILEIGTSYGYSTIWLADAARATEGKVITLELQSSKQEYAREQLKKAGLEEFVDFRPGDAQESLAKLDGPVDFVLLDLWKDLYIPCFDLFYPRLSPGALVVADNMTYPESAQAHAAIYRKHVRSTAHIQSMLLPIGQGLEVSRCIRNVEAVAV
jgi:predicted O-methyltransferase YrrM